MTPLDRLEKFVLDNYECPRKWEEGKLREWLLWAFDHGFLFLLVDRNGNPRGMVIARPLDPKDAVIDSFTEYSPNSGNIYVDLTIGKDAMEQLMLQLIKRFGIRDTISFHRYGRSKEPKFYDFRKFGSKILRS